MAPDQNPNELQSNSICRAMSNGSMLDICDLATLQAAILALIERRRPESSIFPSEAARAVAIDGHDWRPLMPLVRDAACALALRGTISIKRGSLPVALDSIDRGPIRLRRGPLWTTR
ncbi:MAG: DUF3253 domain-containing protein [Burkholderiales bacterium]